MSTGPRCPECGAIKAARCEAGEIEYLSGFYACPKHPDKTRQPRLNPDFIVPALLATAEEEWTWEPEPTAAGLEDLLGEP